MSIHKVIRTSKELKDNNVDNFIIDDEKEQDLLNALLDSREVKGFANLGMKKGDLSKLVLDFFDLGNIPS